MMASSHKLNPYKPSTPEYRDGNGFIAEVIRTNRRKSADIRVEEGAVSIVVPANTLPEKIDQLLIKKRQWIKEKMILQQELNPPSSKQYLSGEAFSYLGRNYRLKVERGNFAPVKLIHGRLVVTVPKGSEQPQMIRNALIRWYKRQAEHKLQEKVKRYAAIVGVEPTGVAIKSFKSRWGSCSAKGKIDFNWKIILAPNRMVDYVVVHELCHLKHHDHSPQFWNEVQRHIPDYSECRDWLRKHSSGLIV
jgi:hypothetical protein